MSVFRTSVLISSFRNIDLFEQAVCRIKVELCEGAPVSLEVCKSRRIPCEKHRLSEGSIEDSSVLSRSFLIKYAEEEAELNELAVFRSEGAVPSILSVSLLFSELRSNASEHEVIMNPEEFANFKTASTQQVQVQSGLEGGSSFISVLFDEMYLCQVNLVIHCVLIECEDTEQLLRVLKKNRQLLDSLLSYTESSMQTNCTDNNKTHTNDNELSELISLVEQNIVCLLKLYPSEITLFMQRDYIQRLKEYWDKSTFRDFHFVNSLTEMAHSSTGTHHSKISEMLRRTAKFAATEALETQQVGYFPARKHHPVLFQDVSYTSSHLPETS